ncbi:MAG TPA: bifunctional nuclease family protein [Spirochaetota bacterium]|nr:bifunctional nuclease family protein [Spirochaetota bacterium]HPN82816.1 bifunctional nuclease family protein [Spirochaetota bacterium]
MDESLIDRVVIENISFSNMGFVVLLRKTESRNVLPIFIGPNEAHSIAAAYNNQSFPRPLTHDLFANTLKLLDCHIPRIVITDLVDNVFFSKVYLVRNDAEKYQIDARPSDAIALALRFGAPLFVSKLVLQTATVPLPDEEPKPESMDPVGELKKELELAISEERYEDAARLRDELKKINNEN